MFHELKQFATLIFTPPPLAVGLSRPISEVSAVCYGCYDALAAAVAGLGVGGAFSHTTGADCGADQYLDGDWQKHKNQGPPKDILHGMV